MTKHDDSQISFEKFPFLWSIFHIQFIVDPHFCKQSAAKNVGGDVNRIYDIESWIYAQKVAKCDKFLMMNRLCTFFSLVKPFKPQPFYG